MNVRQATSADLDAIEALATAYRREATSWLAPASGEAWRELWEPLAGLGGVVFVAEDRTGLVGLLALAPVFHPVLRYRYAETLAWYVMEVRRDTLHGGRVAVGLLHEGERWAVAEGLHLVKVFAPVGSALAYSLPRMGYSEIETSFGRRL